MAGGYVLFKKTFERNMTEYYYGKLEDFEINNKPETCRYQGYGADFDSSENYQKWQVLAARLTFVIVFEHCVIAVIVALACFIRKTVYKIKTRTKKSSNKSPPPPPPAAADTALSSAPRTHVSGSGRGCPENAIHDNNNVQPRDVVAGVAENVFAVKDNGKTNGFGENPAASESTKIVMVDMEVVSDDDDDDDESRGRRRADENENSPNVNSTTNQSLL